jgi:hypothetical protein
MADGTRSGREAAIDGEGTGRDGRECPGQGSIEEAPEGNREGRSSGTLGQEGGFDYFIEIADGRVVKIGFSSAAPPHPPEDALSSLFREHFADLGRTLKLR